MTREEALGLINGFQAGKIDADNHDFYHALDFVVELLESRSQEPQGLDEAARKAGLEYAPVRSGEAIDTNGDYYETDDVEWPSRCGFINGFKAGAEWMAGQGESITATVVSFNGGNILSYDEEFAPLVQRRKLGDKVIVQIRKANEKEK